MNEAFRTLTVGTILKWADQHHEWTGRWPTSRCGDVLGCPGETWEGINTALRKGGRGFDGGTTLHQLLVRRRKIADPRRLYPEMTRHEIVEWARLHHMKCGRWPTRDSGRVASARPITWSTVWNTLRRGGVNLPGGQTLRQLLREELFVWSVRGNRPLSFALILRWADEHHARTGRWPIVMSGKIPRQTHTWAAINEALKHGRCGLPGGTTLVRLLREERGEDYDVRLAIFTEKQILNWAHDYHRRHRRWPTAKSGYWPPAKVPWSTISRALIEGRQGLPGGSSLAKLLRGKQR